VVALDDLPHILEVTDRVVVLRLGKVVADEPTASFTAETLLGTITGLTRGHDHAFRMTHAS
jgi:ABC-type sugar transport system ATPase subunit